MATSNILKLPVFSLRQFEESSVQEKAAISDKLHRGCQEHGFFCISAHSVPKDVIKSAVEVGRDFYALPQSVKE